MAKKVYKRVKNYVLSIGSNLGDKKSNIELAIQLLEEQIGSIHQVSSVYYTKAWGDTSLNDFYNLVLIIKSTNEPMDVMNNLLQIERQLGRKRKTENYENRIIDLDVIYIEDIILNGESLQVPHPRMHERAFVLVPLMEILPHFKHPIFKQSTIELVENLEINQMPKQLFKF